jgi:hydroxymethylglutaryl-CoA reductase (NADPH)
LKKQLTNALQSVSRRACANPIHTIVVIALLASTTYVGLLEGSLFDARLGSRDVAGQLDISSLLKGGRNLRLGERTSWRWQIDENTTSEDDQVRIGFTHGEILKVLTVAMQVPEHIALTTFIFPDSTWKSTSTAPLVEEFPIPEDFLASPVPHTPNLFAPFSHDSSLAYALPIENLSDFIRVVQEIPDPTADDEDGTEQRKWILKTARGPIYRSRGALKSLFADRWSSFVDLIKVRIPHH